MNGTELTKRIMLALSDLGCLVWRNNVGALRDQHGRMIRFGVGNPGGADLIGMLPGGRFLAIEVKGEGDRPRVEQEAYLAAVTMQGGLGIFAYSVEDAVNAVRMSGPLRKPHQVS